MGTTACKACLFNEKGSELARSSIEYSLITLPGGCVEQDAEVWFKAVRQNITEILKNAGGDVKALSFSTQGISFVPVDETGTPLYNAISWLDTCASCETEVLEKYFGADGIYDKTGKPVFNQYSLPKLMWFAKNCVKLYEKTYKFMTPPDYLNFRLTGKTVTDRSMASGTMLYNIKLRRWDEEISDFSGISIDKLPEVRTAGECLGTVKPEIAKKLGIPETKEVILGGQDQKLAAIGAGIAENICTVSMGTSSTAITKLVNPAGFFESDAFKEFKRFKCPIFDFDDSRIFAEPSLSTTGAAIKWLSSILGISYEEMDTLAEKAAYGANGVRFDANLSESGSITRLNLASSKKDIVRALYEDICYGIKEKVGMVGGAKELRVFGGGFKSKILRRILADIMNVGVYAADTVETAVLGAAILASLCQIPAAGINK